jgi:lysophospholipase L1-like esterase
MEWYEAEVRALEKDRTRHETVAKPAVFYGSSTIRLWHTLAADLGNPRALNLGFGGATLEACAHYFERLVPPLDPCSLVLYAGDNDLGDGRTPQAVLTFFQSLMSKMARWVPGVHFSFISIKPSPARVKMLDRVRLANGLIRDEMQKGRQGQFIDVFDAMLDCDGVPRPKLFEADGLHLSRDGYRLWSSLLFSYRNKIFTTDCSSLKPPGVRLPTT